jgi:uncharacterized protein (TIGR03435 family)
VVLDGIDSDRFDIVAKAATDQLARGREPSADDRTRTRERLQTLLADRFHLVLTRTVTQSPVYILHVAEGGPKLKESTSGGAGSLQ